MTSLLLICCKWNMSYERVRGRSIIDREEALFFRLARNFACRLRNTCVVVWPFSSLRWLLVGPKEDDASNDVCQRKATSTIASMLIFEPD